MAKADEGKGVKILIVQAGRDELVAVEHGLELEEIGRGSGVEGGAAKGDCWGAPHGCHA